MKRFLLVVFFLVLIAAVILGAYDCINMYLFARTNSNAIEKMDRLMGNVKTENIAIFGSSRASSHYLPDVIGTNVYNYGISGSAMLETLFLIRKRLEHFDRGVIIINLDPSSFAAGWDDVSKSPFRGEYRLVARDRRVFNELPIGVVSVEDVLPGLRFWGELRKNITALIPNREMMSTKGAEVWLSAPDVETWNRKVLKSSRFDFSVGDGVQSALDDIYAFAKPGVTFVWVASPLAACYFDRVTGLDRMRQFVDVQARRANVKCIWLVESARGYDFSFFYDPYHFCLKGAESFSKRVRVELDAIPEIYQ